MQPTGDRLGSGILLLRDTKPEEGPDASLAAIKAPLSGDGAPEPDAPDVFEWLPGAYY